jgi:hypothetical protein
MLARSRFGVPGELLRKNTGNKNPGTVMLLKKFTLARSVPAFPLLKRIYLPPKKTASGGKTVTMTEPASPPQRMGIKLSHDSITGEPVAGLFLLRPGEPEPDQPNLTLSSADIRQVIGLLEDTLDELEHGETAGRLQ